MGGIRLITTLYTIFFVLIILIVIGSFFGVFENPMIDPGLQPALRRAVYGFHAGRAHPSRVSFEAPDGVFQAAQQALYARAGVREYWIVDPVSRAVEILTLDRDAFHTVQRASGEDAVLSSLLGEATFPVVAIFAGVDQPEA